MIFRKVTFWLHLLIGILSGIVVLIMSVTGVALTYQKQITAWADKKACMINPSPDSVTLSAEEVVNSFRKSHPDVKSFTLTVYSDPLMPAGAAISRSETIFIDPYNGDILGTGSERVRSFFRVMTNWHRWLALSGDRLRTGKAVTGAANLAFLFVLISGIYLWWPRRWTMKILRSVSWFRTGLSSKGRDFNWHNVFGLWCAIPLFFIIISATVISYPWATGLLFRLTGSSISWPSGPSGSPKNKPDMKIPEDTNIIPLRVGGLNQTLEKVKQDAGSWRAISFQPPPLSNEDVSFSVERGWGGQPQLRTTVIANISTGEIVNRVHFRDMDPGLRARLWMRFVHTGEYYGIAGQTIAGIASAGGVVLVWTGIALSLRRYASWNRRRARKRKTSGRDVNT